MNGLQYHNEEFEFYFMGIEKILANAVHKILDHIYSISKVKWYINIFIVVIIYIEYNFLLFHLTFSHLFRRSFKATLCPINVIEMVVLEFFQWALITTWLIWRARNTKSQNYFFFLITVQRFYLRGKDAHISSVMIISFSRILFLTWFKWPLYRFTHFIDVCKKDICNLPKCHKANEWLYRSNVFAGSDGTQKAMI